MTNNNFPTSCARCMTSYLPKPVEYDGMTFCCPECFIAYLNEREGLGLGWVDEIKEQLNYAFDDIEKSIKRDFSEISSDFTKVSDKLDDCILTLLSDRSKKSTDKLREVADELAELIENINVETYDKSVQAISDAIDDLDDLLKF